MHITPKGIYSEGAASIRSTASSQVWRHVIGLAGIAGATVESFDSERRCLTQLLRQERARLPGGFRRQVRKGERQCVEHLVGVIEISLISADAQSVMKWHPRKASQEFPHVPIKFCGDALCLSVCRREDNGGGIIH